MIEESGAAQAEPEDLGKIGLTVLALLPLLLLVYYYWPCLSAKAEFYISDLTYFFQPFCNFVNNELRSGRIPLWNSYLYCGMPQLAMPSPGLLYPASWFTFLLPFSAGLSLYMIFHQLLLGVGSYLYLRDTKASRAASVYAAAVLSLSAYSFAFIRNMTLPASMAWLPLSLYFERRIEPGKSGRLFVYMIGLALSVAMIVDVGRPEVGVPELLLLFFACISRPLLAIVSREKAAAASKATLYKLAALTLGVSLALPTIVPGIEWASLSPRSQGLAKRWVLMWSANWYDYLSIVLSQPLGDLCSLDQHTAQFRRLVLSRAGYLPFLSSTYLSPIAVTMAIWGLSDRQNKMRALTLVLLIGFILMSLGGYTPIASAIVDLSPVFAVFRYPVKLMLFPCLFLLLLAVRGMDLLLSGKLSLRLLIGTILLWSIVLVSAILMALFPQIGVLASKWRWLFHAEVALSILKEAQFMMAQSMLYSSVLALAACLAAYLCCRQKLRPVNAAFFIVVLSCATLIHSALSYRRITPAGFYEHPSTIARKLQELEKIPKVGDRGGASGVQVNVSAMDSRVLNLYFDPLTVPEKYKDHVGSCFDEDFFQYSREMILYNSGLCWQIPSSYGYEAAETADYKTFFTQAFSASGLRHRDKTDKKEIINDLPIHRFAALTASQYINTQIYRRGDGDIPKLNSNYFKLLEENSDLNYRIYRSKNIRPRIYFSQNLVFVESFKDFQKLVSTREKVPQTEIFDHSTDITYLLNRDLAKYREQFKGINPGDLNSWSRAIRNSKKLANCELVSDNGQEMKLKLGTLSQSLLVIADHFYPGWVAELDGKKIEILKANMINRAVLIPPGLHVLKVYYCPQSLVFGSAGAIVSLLIFLLGYLLFCKRRS